MKDKSDIFKMLEETMSKMINDHIVETISKNIETEEFKVEEKAPKKKAKKSKTAKKE